MADGGGGAGTIRRRRATTGLVAALLIVAPMVVLHGRALAAGGAGAIEAGGAPDVEAAFMTRVAAERQAEGRSTLAVEDDLVAVARQHSATMASENQLYHNPALGQQVVEWQLVGENVGTGSSVDEVHGALMASSQHRGEILDPRFTGIGVGVVRAGDALWVTEVFRQRAAAGPPSPPPPPPVDPPAAVDPRPAAPVVPARRAPAPRVRRATTASTAAATTTAIATTTTTAPAPPPPPQAVKLDPVAVAVSLPLPVGPALADAGILAAVLLWTVVAGLARVTIRLHPSLALRGRRPV